MTPEEAIQGAFAALANETRGMPVTKHFTRAQLAQVYGIENPYRLAPVIDGIGEALEAMAAGSDVSPAVLGYVVGARVGEKLGYGRGRGETL